MGIGEIILIILLILIFLGVKEVVKLLIEISAQLNNLHSFLDHELTKIRKNSER